MHSYSSDAKDGYIALAAIALASLVCAYGLAAVLDFFKVAVPWWLDAPSVLGFYALFFGFYNQTAWRLRILGHQLSRVPDIRGTWYGETISNHAGETRSDAMLYIAQTWSKISIYFKSDRSDSYSRMASLNITQGPNEGLIYEYGNEPVHGAPSTMHGHRGLAFYRLWPSGRTLEGGYFTGRDRGTFGKATFERVCIARLDLNQARGVCRKEHNNE